MEDASELGTALEDGWRKDAHSMLRGSGVRNTLGQRKIWKYPENANMVKVPSKLRENRQAGKRYLRAKTVRSVCRTLPLEFITMQEKRRSTFHWFTESWKSQC